MALFVWLGMVCGKGLALPQRRKSAHKGDAGKLLVVGGCEEFVGAPALAAKAAFRAGVDWVEVAAPSKVSWAINALDPTLITHKLRCEAFSPQQVPRVLALARRVDAVLLGNGLGRSPARLAFVRSLLAKLDKPVVIDADALHATDLRKVVSKRVVCTPHAREFSALLAASGSDEKGLRILLSAERVVLLKGPVDRIFAGRQTSLHRGGVPEMAVAGTGDVLAGFCAGLVAQGLSAQRAACLAAFHVGRAGERAKRVFGNFTASELIDQLK